MEISQSQSYNLEKCWEVTKYIKTKVRKCIEKLLSLSISYK